MNLAVATAPRKIPLAGEFAGAVSKEFVETLLKRTSAIEKKLDVLLREPFKTGLHLLRESIAHPGTSGQEIQSRDTLLDAAHVSAEPATNTNHTRITGCVGVIGWGSWTPFTTTVLIFERVERALAA